MKHLLLAVTVVAACAGDQPINILPPDGPSTVLCGDGIVEGDEACDDGNLLDGDDCSADCSAGVTCGNGASDPNEVCDDGNRIGGDGCSADCRSNERCGNGIVDLVTGETCDDNNTTGGDGCSASCQSNEGCGNGTVDNGEQCDAGPNGSATCDVNCTTAACGDGTVNSFRGEQCDAGPNGDAGCDVDCTPALCGDSVVNAARGETCDDGNNVTTDACISCKAAVCGDGIVRTGVEQCDDSNTTPGDGCNATCQIEQQPRVYVLNNNTCNTLVQAENQFACTSTQLIGFTRDCGGDVDRTNPYDNCSGAATGFRWMDATPFQPSMVTVEVNVGINSLPNGTAVTQTAVTNLNGTASGNFTLAANAGQTTCNPVETIQTWTLTNVASYRRNQINTLNIAGMTGGCWGVGFTAAFNGYVRVTVFP